MHPTVLIVSVYYKRESMVDESVQSLVSQLEPGMHLVLVDDGSPDRTFERLKAFEADNVTVITHANMGFVHSVRAGIDLMPSTYIAIHGSGDLSLPGRFRKQIDYLDQHPQVGLVATHSTFVYSAGDHPSHREGKSFTGDARWRMLEGNLMNHGTVMMRRDCYDQVGGYRTFFKFAQDRDLFCRLSQITHIHIIEEPLYVRYFGVADSVSGAPHKVVMQRFLSDFACYCHSQRLAGKPDPLDQYGPHAALLWAPSRRVHKEIFRRAMRALYFKRSDEFAVYKDALLQTDVNLIYRTLLLLAEKYPPLINYGMETYYKSKVAGLKAPS